jgi:Tol biopolymer transport system component/tRNA A-37 threonylcarbamoyl transferase component Bud32
MSLTAGTRLGHYEIVALIGAGGMGQVYEARDPRLNRTVAIKILLEHMSLLPEARARFEREAQLIAGLNHPHISILHDVGRHEQIDFFVMELVEGETLAARLLRGPLPVPEALRHAIDIASALDQAHRHGVTHRDLKPGNVMLTRSGVKLLDFGLAKFQPRNAVSALVTQADVTAEGEILGTLQYMAPEQLEGHDADARTDIFAFGTMLHEMITGKKAFDGPSRTSLMRSIMSDTPPLVSTLQPVAPPALDRLIATCLAKDPDDRWQSARDVWRELTWLLANTSAASGHLSGGEKAPAPGLRNKISLATAAAFVLIGALAAAALVWTLKPAGKMSPSSVARLAMTLPPGDRLGDPLRPAFAFSPDGGSLAYVGLHGATTQLFIRAIDSLETRPIPGTDRAVAPFFSPDGEWIGFFATGKLKKVGTNGGAVQTVCDAASSMGGTWAADDTIYFAPFNTSGLLKVSASGGTPTPATMLDRSKGEVSHRWPQVLPGGKAIIFTVWTGPGSDERHLHLQMLDSGERRVLVQGASTGRYVASGHILYSREDALFAVPFDLAHLQVTGTPVPLAERAFDDEGAHFSVSASGMLAYMPASPRRFERRLVWVDTAGNVDPLPLPPRAYTDPMLSSDGRFVAFTVLGPIEAIWVYDLTRHTLGALTSTSAGSSQSPTWAPDGTRIVYRGSRTGFRNLFWRLVDGGGEEERLTASETLHTPTSWSPDGKYLAFVETAVGTGADIVVLRIDRREPTVFLKTGSVETNPRFAPDGQWLAYSSDESGTSEVYVRAFPGPGGKLRVSTDGGTEPVWSHNGDELYYRNRDRMMAVSLLRPARGAPQATPPTLTAGPPRTIFEGHYMQTDTGGAGYDVSSTGRFLMVQPVEPEEPATQINIVVNWFEALKQRNVK